MGGEAPKPVKKPTLEETILDMKMTAKRFQIESNRAEKEKNREIEKARNAIKKGNDEGARLFLSMAAMKQKESMQSLRMAHKMDAMCTIIKGNTSNVAMMDSLNKIAPLLNAQAQNVPVEKIYNDMEKFEKSMDDILVSGKVMDQLLNANSQDVNQDLAVDNMLVQMKKEMILDVNNDLNTNNQQLFKELNNPQANVVNNNNNVLHDRKWGRVINGI